MDRDKQKPDQPQAATSVNGSTAALSDHDLLHWEDTTITQTLESSSSTGSLRLLISCLACLPLLVWVFSPTLSQVDAIISVRSLEWLSNIGTTDWYDFEVIAPSGAKHFLSPVVVWINAVSQVLPQLDPIRAAMLPGVLCFSCLLWISGRLGFELLDGSARALIVGLLFLAPPFQFLIHLAGAVFFEVLVLVLAIDQICRRDSRHGHPFRRREIRLGIILAASLLLSGNVAAIVLLLILSIELPQVMMLDAKRPEEDRTQRKSRRLLQAVQRLLFILAIGLLCGGWWPIVMLFEHGGSYAVSYFSSLSSIEEMGFAGTPRPLNLLLFPISIGLSITGLMFGGFLVELSQRHLSPRHGTRGTDREEEKTKFAFSLRRRVLLAILLAWIAVVVVGFPIRFDKNYWGSLSCVPLLLFVLSNSTNQRMTSENRATWIVALFISFVGWLIVWFQLSLMGFKEHFAASLWLGMTLVMLMFVILKEKTSGISRRIENFGLRQMAMGLLLVGFVFLSRAGETKHHARNASYMNLAKQLEVGHSYRRVNIVSSEKPSTELIYLLRHRYRTAEITTHRVNQTFWARSGQEKFLEADLVVYWDVHPFSQSLIVANETWSLAVDAMFFQDRELSIFRIEDE